MKSAKLFILFVALISLFSIPAYAQKSITDADFSDVINLIAGTFPERRIKAEKSSEPTKNQKQKRKAANQSNLFE